MADDQIMTDTTMNPATKWTPPDARSSTQYVECVSKDASGAEVYKYWIVDTSDNILAHVQIRDDGALFYKANKVETPYDWDALRIPVAVKVLVQAVESTYIAARSMARVTEDANTVVGKRSRDDEKQTYRVKMPPEWDCSGQTPKAMASSLPVWLIEVKDYLAITHTPEDIRASVACSMLGKHARAQYIARRTTSELANTEFKHTMQFFENTLVDLFVPRAQRAEDLRSFLRGEWRPAESETWTLQDYVSEFMAAWNKVLGHGVPLDDVIKVQVCLVWMPEPCYHEFKLTESNDYQSNWGVFNAMLTRRQPQAMTQYHTWLASGKPQSFEPTNKKMRFSLGAGSVGKGPTSGHGGTTPGSTGKGASINQVAKAQGDKGRVKELTCGICRSSSHLIALCPFLDTNINYNRVGKKSVPEELLKQVRANPTSYTTNGKVNEQFRAAGGKEVKTKSGK